MKKLTKLMLIVIMVILTSLIFQSCSYSSKYRTNIKRHYPRKASYENIDLYGLNDNLPQNFEVITEIEVTSTEWSDAQQKLENKAREVGADALKITSRKYMSWAFPVPATKFTAVLVKYGNSKDIEEVKMKIENWEVKKITEQDAKRYYDLNNSRLSPIEGIWSMSETRIVKNLKTNETRSQNNDQVYRIAVIADSVKQNYKYAAYIIESKYDHWKLGMLKACFRETAYPMIYEGLWFKLNMSEEKKTYIIDEYGLITQEDTFYEKQYPDAEFYTKSVFLKAYPPLNNYKPIVSEKITSTGSGCMISKSGIVFTNYHVIEDKNEIECYFPELDVTKKVKILLKDKKNDLALLKIDDFKYNDLFKQNIPFKFKHSEDSNIGTETFTLGFPLGETLGKEAKLSKGVITSTSGLQDDPVLFQIDNPIQPGNSGGALFDSKGYIIGIIVSSLNAKFFYETASIIPQNVNFAIKSNYLLNLISMLPEEDEIINRDNSLTDLELTEQIKQIKPFIVTIKAK